MEVYTIDDKGEEFSCTKLRTIELLSRSASQRVYATPENRQREENAIGGGRRWLLTDWRSSVVIRNGTADRSGLAEECRTEPFLVWRPVCHSFQMLCAVWTLNTSVQAEHNWDIRRRRCYRSIEITPGMVRLYRTTTFLHYFDADQTRMESFW